MLPPLAMWDTNSRYSLEILPANASEAAQLHVRQPLLPDPTTDNPLGTVEDRSSAFGTDELVHIVLLHACTLEDGGNCALIRESVLRCRPFPLPRRALGRQLDPTDKQPAGMQ